MGIATDYLRKAILTRHERLVVDAAGVHLAKASLAALGNKTLRPGQLLVPVTFVGESQAIRGTIDYHCGLGQSLLSRVGRLQTQLFEVRTFFSLNGQSCPPAHQVSDFGPIP